VNKNRKLRQRHLTMRLPRHLLLILAALSAAACSSRAPARHLLEPAGMLAAHRVVESRTGAEIGFTALADRAAASELVFFGELHDDAGTHRLQLALLEALAERRDDVVLSLEMFERDVQPALDAYLAGQSTEAEFLAAARPWPNYATDYRPLVEFARVRGWPVLAANVPRPLAALVARGGLEVLDELPAAERALAASELSCPHDRYYERFVETMGTHPGMDEAMVLRFYQAQCVKDETMAESIAAAPGARTGALVVHMNGSFHSDYGDGVPARVKRRRPGARLLILSGIPVEPGAALHAEDRERADYLLFTRRPAR
jgi:uncharacterized iron-regulated protein